jgi:hypothetical protein
MKCFTAPFRSSMQASHWVRRPDVEYRQVVVPHFGAKCLAKERQYPRAVRVQQACQCLRNQGVIRPLFALRRKERRRVPKALPK